MNGFGAMLHRINYIDRWGLMRNARRESLSEHSFGVAYIAHILAAMAQVRYGADIDIDRVVCCALYHDASEVLTGDMPTPVKYGNEALRREYKAVEQAAQKRVVEKIPADLRAVLGGAIEEQGLSDRERQIIKSADKLSALIKCLEEETNGNTEFRSAKESALKALKSDPNPETADFLNEMIPAYVLTLDEILAL